MIKCASYNEDLRSVAKEERKEHDIQKTNVFVVVN